MTTDPPKTCINRPAIARAEPCIVVIFGAAGDLSRRKLVPALNTLEESGGLPDHVTVLGVDHDPIGADRFRARMAGAIGDAPLLRRLDYLSGDLNDPAVYDAVAAHCRQANAAAGIGNRLFYCATPPTLAGAIVDGLQRAGLSDETAGWTRIIVEKPFGRDLASACALNRRISRVFDEHQVYRIDHYLGKETVQNILVFRFGNTLSESFWNSRYIDYVEITAAERLGIGHRAAYYEEAGALRDMVTNHLMQLLALTAMEPPLAFDADAVRDQKLQVWRSIRPMDADRVAACTVRGQYAAGAIDGEAVVAYRQEAGVAADSPVETYAAMDFRIDNARWAGVPFYLRTGKRLAAFVTEIAVHLKRPPHALFADAPGLIEPNVVLLRIQPDEGIHVTFGAKRPGAPLKIADVTLDFTYRDAFGSRLPDAYETLLLDAMLGDATLFTRKDGVEAQWRLIGPIEDAWTERGLPPLVRYAAGGQGPAEAERLPGRNGHRWRCLTEPAVRTPMNVNDPQENRHVRA